MALEIRKAFGRDQDKVNGGVEVPLDAEGAFIKIRHRSADAVQEAVKNLTRQERLLWDSGQLGKGRGREVFARVVATGAIVGWGGLLLNGKEVKYSQKEAEKMLANPEYEGFLETVIEYMGDDALFGLDDFEEASKNSSTPSNSS